MFLSCRGVASPDCPGGQSWWASRWRVSANCALARTGGCLRGDVPPSEAGRFWNFDTEFTQFSDNFYAKFIPLEMFKYLWNNVYSLSSPFSSPPFSPFFSSLFLSFPFSSPFPFPFPFLFLSLLPSLSSFLFLSPFFPFPIFALLPDFWCPRGQSAPPAPPLATPLLSCLPEVRLATSLAEPITNTVVRKVTTNVGSALVFLIMFVLIRLLYEKLCGMMSSEHVENVFEIHLTHVVW